MDIPDLVQRAAGDEEIEAGVSLGDEDAVCLTPTRTLVYNGEGLLSDEQVEEFPHDVERIAVSEGRRKTKFVLEYIDGTRSFTVPSSRDDRVLELLLEGVLRLESVIGERESLVGVYRFSELTLIVAEGRIVKLIGEQVWTDDYEVYPYEDVTALDFERASVATSVVISVDGRPQRVKVPNEKAPVVRQTIEKAVFAYYDVSSLEELNRLVGADEAVTAAADDGASGIDFGAGIDPLVTDEDEDVAEHAEGALEDIPTSDGETADEQSASGTASADTPSSSASANPDDADGEKSATTAGAGGEGGSVESESADSGSDETDGPQAETATPDAPAGDTADAGTTGDAAVDEGAVDSPTDESGATSTAAQSGATPTPAESGTDTAAGGVEPASREDLEVVADRLDDLTEAVDRQNELLKRQHRAIRQLVDELRSG